jgi:hypothetical protein
LAPCCAAVWPALALVKNVVLMRLAVDRLHRHFREMVLERLAVHQAGGAKGG